MAYPYHISVVVPAYGSPDKLAACLDAALKQSLPADDFEVVVVDDCSPAPLDGVVRHFQTLYPAHHLVFERNAVNSGRALTRNAGIRLARGRVLMFLDLDNWLTPSALERMLAYFQVGAGSARANIASLPGAVNQSSYVRFFNSRYLGQRPAAELAEMDLGHLHERYFATDAIAVDRDSIDRVGGFDPTFSHYGCEDEELGLRLADAGVPFRLALDVAVVDGDFPTVRRACERMVEYASTSIPTLIAKHPRYVEHCMFPFLEKRPETLSLQARLLRTAFLRALPFQFGQALVAVLERYDRTVSFPAALYKLALGIYYAHGYRLRRGP